MARSGDLLGAPPPAPISIGDIALGTAAGSLLFWVGVGVLGLVLASASDDDAEPPPLPNPFARR